MAHVPDLDDFVDGLNALLSDDGVITIENQYVVSMIDRLEFDTVYHEHFSYFSCTAIDEIMRRHGLRLIDVDEFPELHGGTLRWSVARRGEPSDAAREMLERERRDGVATISYYEGFATRVADLRSALVELMTALKRDGKRLAGYGAAAKGSTLCNYAGIDTDLIDFVVDRSPHKQGKYLPGVRVPIRPVDALIEDQPDVTLLLAWNFAAEIMQQQDEYRRRGGRFLVPIPSPLLV